ncbi:hypothetical protein CMV_004656 [Castanea mollissima]|uniref:Uncharacterized protein n=1 Tax=Castanea mollissima TaxID=60419 RepID=A0A8J4RU15_9ROSI|nr:hypothetical protein CMV_004656 [Castanea mollissima]
MSLSVCNTSLSPSLSGILIAILPSPSCHADLAIADLTTSRDRDHSGSPLITDPLCDEEELQSNLQKFASIREQQIGGIVRILQLVRAFRSQIPVTNPGR